MTECKELLATPCSSTKSEKRVWLVCSKNLQSIKFQISFTSPTCYSGLGMTLHQRSNSFFQHQNMPLTLTCTVQFHNVIEGLWIHCPKYENNFEVIVLGNSQNFLTIPSKPLKLYYGIKEHPCLMTVNISPAQSFPATIWRFCCKTTFMTACYGLTNLCAPSLLVTVNMASINWQKNVSLIIWQAILAFTLSWKRLGERHTHLKVCVLNWECFKDSFCFQLWGSSTWSMCIRHFPHHWLQVGIFFQVISYTMTLFWFCLYIRTCWLFYYFTACRSWQKTSRLCDRRSL